MKWFQGSMAEAVTTSKAKKAVFVVFVEGKDDASQKVAETMDSTEVSSRLETEKFIAVKLQSDTENYTYFAQIYHIVPVPSIFFIGINGLPLEVIGNPLSSSELASKIDSILSKANEPEQASSNLIGAEQAESNANSVPNPSQISDHSNGNVTSEGPVTQTGDDGSDVSQEEKIKRARILIEQQNKKRQEEEERKERERELQRRKMGQDIQKIRQMQQEKEIKEAHQERLREKAAEKAARDKVLKQIAEDKAERKRRQEKLLQQEQGVQQPKPGAENKAQAKPVPTGDLSKTRIQFKLPTGNNITGTFESSSTLGSLRSYVIEKAQPTFQFSMSSFFPRKDFTTADESKTLLELDLAPSAVILILAARTSNPASVLKSSDGAGMVSHFFWTLFAPVVSIYNYIVGYFGGRPRTGGNGSNSNDQDPGSSMASNANAAFGRMANVGMRRLGSQGTSKIRARGNIHTLHSGNNDDDENNTWNGNSTQQM
ncbi:hypothetical protein QAD02_022368 [Eretmocerus hayati]|uniref:Uncharacterized protein n=1 Tax=Eretmocerus hayati TaxID=131215 RepID=A0ACC2PSK5_9HYME|nr:hypothetical protein QAD02_022368 [Eretmocerus hayati]